MWYIKYIGINKAWFLLLEVNLFVVTCLFMHLFSTCWVFLWELVMVFALLDARGGIQDLGTGFLPLSYLSRPLFRLYCLWRTFTYVGMWIIGIFQLRKSPQGNEMTSPRVNKAWESKSFIFFMLCRSFIAVNLEGKLQPDGPVSLIGDSNPKVLQYLNICLGRGFQIEMESELGLSK